MNGVVFFLPVIIFDFPTQENVKSMDFGNFFIFIFIWILGIKMILLEFDSSYWNEMYQV